MPIPRPGAGDGADALSPDELRWRLIGAFRDGRYVDGSIVAIADLVTEFGVSRARLMPAVDHIVLAGHATRTDDRHLLITRPTVDDWADEVMLITGLNELATHDVVPLLDDDGAAELTALLERARRLGALRNVGYTEAIWAVHGYLADHTPNRLLGRAMRIVMSRAEIALTPTVQFDQWDMPDYFAMMLEAVASRDVELATEAARCLMPYASRHVAQHRATMEG
jgi:DNA-binding GntR family transcriptional regulator